jgi:hypothetical protein
MFEFDLTFQDVPLYLGHESIEVMASGIAHMIGEFDGASVVDIWMRCERDGKTRERMLDRSNPIELGLYRLLATSIEKHCAARINEIIDERCGGIIAKAQSLDRQFYQSRL